MDVLEANGQIFYNADPLTAQGILNAGGRVLSGPDDPYFTAPEEDPIYLRAAAAAGVGQVVAVPAVVAAPTPPVDRQSAGPRFRLYTVLTGGHVFHMADPSGNVVDSPAFNLPQESSQANAWFNAKIAAGFKLISADDQGVRVDTSSFQAGVDSSPQDLQQFQSIEAMRSYAASRSETPKLFNSGQAALAFTSAQGLPAGGGNVVGGFSVCGPGCTHITAPQRSGVPTSRENVNDNPSAPPFIGNVVPPSDLSKVITEVETSVQSLTHSATGVLLLVVLFLWAIFQFSVRKG